MECDYAKFYVTGFVPQLDELVPWGPCKAGVDVRLKARGRKSYRGVVSKNTAALPWLERGLSSDVCYDIAGDEAGAMDLWGWSELAQVRPDMTCVRFDLCEWVPISPEWVIENRFRIKNFRRVHPVGLPGRQTVYIGRRGHDGTGVSWCVYDHGGSWRWECRFYGSAATELWRIASRPEWEASFWACLKWDSPPPGWGRGVQHVLGPPERVDAVAQAIRRVAAYIRADGRIRDELEVEVLRASPTARQARAVADHIDPPPF